MQWRFDVARWQRGWYVHRREVAVFLLIVLVTTALWWPAIRHGRSIVIGDSLQVSLPMLSRLWAYLRGGPSLMWVPEIYGGHPLFAEGQGAFLSPLTLLMAIFFKPTLGQNLFQYFGMLWMAAGVMQLGKALRLSVWACGIVTLATVFSSSSLFDHSNMTIAGSLFWVPWWLWAVERWLRSLRTNAALVAASILPLMIFSGYPAVVHGAVLFAVVRVAPICLTRAGRRWCRPRLRRLIIGIGLIVVVGLALAAIQLLPTLELTRWSHRHNGTGLTYIPNELDKYIRGMLFPLQADIRNMAGSALVVMLALWSPITCRFRGALPGYAMGGLLMLILGQGLFPSVFDFIYRHNLIPGLHFFRITGTYNTIGILAMAVLAGFAVDGYARWLRRGSVGILDKWITPALLCGVALVILGTLWVERGPRGAWLSYSILLLALAGLGLLRRLACWRAVQPMLFGLLLLWSTMANRYGFHFYDLNDMFADGSLHQLPEQNPRDRRIALDTVMVAYTLLSVSDPRLAGFARHSAAMDGGQASLVSGDWTFNGNLALILANHALLAKDIEKELAGHATAPDGLRLIDLLAIRYVVADWAEKVPLLKPVLNDPTYHFALLRNDYSRGFFQVYDHAVVAASPELALQQLEAGTEPKLVLVRDGMTGGAPAPQAGTAPMDQVQIIRQSQQDDRYALLTKAPGSFWLFLADANYPGWKAWVDGVPTPVWTAQLGGKAVFVPGGSHRVTLRFRSRTFWYGAYISCATLWLMLLYLGRTHWRQRRFIPAADPAV